MTFRPSSPPQGIAVDEYAPSLHPDMSYGSAFQLMKRWYQDCMTGHEQCLHSLSKRSPSNFQYPTRLIDVGAPGSLRWHLRLTSQDPLESIQAGYLTLSHRWGLSPFLQLTSSVVDEFRGGLPIAQLPKTFRDAALIAHTLGIRYIWVDSLCIEQDASKEDWVSEAPNMHRVYGEARLNIIAGYSEDPYGGLFRHRDPLTTEMIVVEQNNAEGHAILHCSRSTTDEFEQAPLMGRGWVFQERLLAPRILHFGKNQVYWRCRDLFAGESFPFGIVERSEKPYTAGLGIEWRDAITSNGLQHGDWLKLWQKMIMDYSRCALTYPEDKLVALSGIAKLAGKILGDRYVAGMWWKDLAPLLCWYRSMLDQRPVGPRPKTYRAPSWSWASIDNPVAYYPGPRSWRQLVKISEAVVKPLDGDETAQLQGGHIKLHGYLIPFKYDTVGRRCTLDSDLGTALKDVELWILPMLYDDLPSSGLFECLLLQQTKANDSVYQRVGHVGCLVYGDKFSLEKDLGVQASIDLESGELISSGDEVKYCGITLI
ncbi:heterokaryon incompatibility protein-domain-containing protein [Cladorrhinum sp. PSN259]|nr:heterokaryon incompatibility protein-domain-containing protein [Cladorrhinum sp. PSN259]